jgi:predicted outer membrane repeat protein
LFSFTGTSVISLNDCYFSSNIAETLIFVSDASKSSHLNTTATSFLNNQGQSLRVEKSHYFDFNSTFFNNSYNFGPAIFADNEGVIILNESKLIENQAESGTIYLAGNSQLFSSGVIFSKNKATVNGAGIHCEKNSEIGIDNSFFYQNQAQVGSAIFMQHVSSNNSFVSNSVISENSAKSSGSIWILESSLSLINVKVFNNSARSSPSLVAMYSSEVFICDCEFHSQVGEGALLYIETLSLAVVYSSKFFGIISDDSSGFSALKIVESLFSCFYCNFYDIKYDIGTLLSCSQSSCTLKSCSIQKVFTRNDGKLILAESSADIVLNYSMIQEFIGVAIYLSPNTQAIIIKTNIQCNS